MEPIKTIGKLLEEPCKRDCIHIAIMPVIVGEHLYAGQPVRLAYGIIRMVISAHTLSDDNCIGVIDPFLDYKGVEKGKRCWVFLKPGTITGLRHDWTCPAVDREFTPANKSINKSEAWLRGFADTWNFDYDKMIRDAQKRKGYVVSRGIDLHSRTELAPGDEELFWCHLQAITGRIFDNNHREEFIWTCTC